MKEILTNLKAFSDVCTVTTTQTQNIYMYNTHNIHVVVSRHVLIYSARFPTADKNVHV